MELILYRNLNFTVNSVDSKFFFAFGKENGIREEILYWNLISTVISTEKKPSNVSFSEAFFKGYVPIPSHV